LRSGKTGS